MNRDATGCSHASSHQREALNFVPKFVWDSTELSRASSDVIRSTRPNSAL